VGISLPNANPLDKDSGAARNPYSTQTNRFWKFVLYSAAAIGVIVAGLTALIWLRLPPGHKGALLQICQNNIYILLGLAFVVIGALWMVFDITYNRYILPLKRISAEAGVIYDSNPSHRINVQGSQDIVRMAGVINDFADLFENLNKTITQQILSARKETEKERNLLAAIMGELPQGIIICNKNGRIILFNTLARSLFFQTSSPGKSETFLGLGRSVFQLIDRSFITHALEEITEQLNASESCVGSFFITPIMSGKLISAHTIPVLDKDKKFTGFILVLEDASEQIGKYQVVDRQLTEFYTLLDAALPADAPCSVKDEFKLLGTRIRESFFSTLPSTHITLATFLPSIQKKTGYFENIRVNMANPFPDTRFLADTYSMTQALVFIFRQMALYTGSDEFDLTVNRNETTMTFTLSWTGDPCPNHRVQSMLKTQLNGLPSLGYVLKFNNTRLIPVEKDPESCTGLILTSRAGSSQSGNRSRQAAPVVSDARPEFYDFDLFRMEEAPENILDTPIKQLTYTVFDTETTGLRPEEGDEIVAIGAVRIVNQRIVFQDFFEALVNPKRDIPLESYKIHGINYEMVREKPGIETVLPRFSQFAGDTILVGHNLAFDLKMFKVKEKATGVRVTNPVLDTLLLSALLHPVHQQHAMENIARRLGVDILGRHTALGDAIATAEIFLKLLPILNSNGILTLKDAIAASRKSYYARLKY